MNILEALEFIKVNTNLMARPVDGGHTGKKFQPVYWDADSRCYRSIDTNNKLVTLSFVSVLRQWEVAKEFTDEITER